MNARISVTLNSVQFSCIPKKMIEINIFHILLLGIIALIYKYVKYSYSYWNRLGVSQLPPTFPFGNFGSNFLHKNSIGDAVAEMYNASVEPFIGVYSIFQPLLIIREPKLINSICVNDFQCFMGRGFYCDEKQEPISGHLFGLDGEKWKVLRGKLSPTFTPSKIKAMFPIIIKTGDILQNFVNKMIECIETNNVTDIDQIAIQDGLFDVKEIVGRYTNDVIASVGFGIDVNSFENPENDFRHAGSKVFELSKKNAIKFLMFLIWPKFYKIFRCKMFDQFIEKFMINVVQTNLQYRQTNNISRQDFFQHLVDLHLNVDRTGGLTIGEMAAQILGFFTAGFETSASTMTFFLYEMAKHADIQQKIHLEIDQVLKRHNNELTFDAVNEMIYLDWCIDETLRLYPTVPFLNRVSTTPYKIPDSNVSIDKDVRILISVIGLHRDPQYFPNPLEFMPERFNPENTANKTFTEMPYFPFGIGPKNCIGLKLGKLQLKVGLVRMLQNYRYNLEPYQTGKMKCVNGNDQLEFFPNNFILAPKHKLLFKVIKI